MNKITLFLIKLGNILETLCQIGKINMKSSICLLIDQLPDYMQK